LIKTFLLPALVAAWLMGCSSSSHSYEIRGRVVNVSDGDTLTVLTAGNVQKKIRLAAIDAPEKKQSFGTQSKRFLESMCRDSNAVVDVVDTDRYGRIVGFVTCNGVGVEKKMVESGMAWVYRSYARGRADLYAAEASARSRGEGLWADNSTPIPPWEWRKNSPR